MCWKELTDKYNFYDAVNNGIKLAVEENNPHVKLMPVGKLRKYVRLYGHKSHMFKDLSNYRVNAIKDKFGVWREWPTGQKIDFHHFPEFDPEEGESGDTLIWYPTDHLRIADKDAHYSPLYYMPKQDVCQTCPDFVPFGNECSDAGDCWRGFCACDTGYTGYKCQESPLPWKQLVSIGGFDLIPVDPLTGIDLSNTVQISNLIDSEFDTCYGIPQYPFPTMSTLVERIHSKILSCAGLIQYEEESLPRASDRCYVFDRADQQWNTFHSLKCARYKASSIITPHGDYWIAGGNPVFPVMPEKAMDSTEIIPFDPKNAPDHWHDGPALPEPLYGGCLVNINDCETAYIGGYSSNISSQSSAIHIYNWNTEDWRVGPVLNVPRDGHKCVKIKNPLGERWTVIIAGGLDTTGMPFDSVEAWDVMTDEIIEFQDSPHFLPTDAADFTFIEIDDYKALALLPDQIPDDFGSEVWTFSYENGWNFHQNMSTIETNSGILTDFRYFHCNYTANVLDLPFEA